MKNLLSTIFTVLTCLLIGLPSHAMTINVDVPSGTKACYIVGDYCGWDTYKALQLTKVSDTRFTITDDALTAASLAKGYKYICGPEWPYVEKGANGEELSNRTVYGNPDVVAKWASTYDYIANLKEESLNVNGYNRVVKIFLPDGYEKSTTAYPVIYYVGVQQRYNDAGNDGDAGDNLFGSVSWDIANRLSAIPEAATKPAIIVATYSFVAENIPYANDEFVGCGQSDRYIDDFVNVVKKYIDKNYRTLADPQSTAIMGADMGAMLAVYAAATRPDVFGRALAVSPMTWPVADRFEADLHDKAATIGSVLLTYGSREPATVKNMAQSMAAALGSKSSVMEIADGLHADDSWGTAFPALYPFLVGGKQPAALSLEGVSAPQKFVRKASMADNTYTLYSKVSSSSSAPANSSLDPETTPFTYVENFRSGAADVKAKVLVRVIPKDVKTYFYWNVKRDADGNFLLSTPGNVSFKSAKSSDSWLRVAILSDESVKNVAASSTGFRVATAAGSTMMSVKSGYVVSASVKFDTNDKAFTIRYGSVNTNSDMGDITSAQSVSASCTAATIDYDFLTNQVKVTETSWGETIGDELVIETFQAIPSVMTAGNSSVVKVAVSGGGDYNATMTISKDYATPTSVALSKTSSNHWTATLPNLAKGFYTLRLSVQRGSAVKSDVSNVCIRVTDSGEPWSQTYMVVNAYEDVDWEKTGRYKANFHTHTSQSFDTKFRTDEVVDRYNAAGYTILALTDHDANSYPWQHFDVYNPLSSPRDPEALGMLAIPGIELSKDNRNNWSEFTGGEYNHHNDLFTGRRGQEFASLQESYAYTEALGGLQIINHPGQYWSLDANYTPGAKNSPEWHADNFKKYRSLIGLEVYNQGNRRPNDRILWDQILDQTMPERPVWGYSCDDTHTAEQYLRNYQWMLMPDLSVESLKAAMKSGSLIFSYEYTGSGLAQAPVIDRIDIDKEAHTITLVTDATNVKWITGTDRSGGASTRKSTAVGRGRTFDYTGFEGSYVRAIVFNSKGETCTQPFGFAPQMPSSGVNAVREADRGLRVFPNPAEEVATIGATATIDDLTIYTLGGLAVKRFEPAAETVEVAVGDLPSGIYLIVATVDGNTFTAKLCKR